MLTNFSYVMFKFFSLKIRSERTDESLYKSEAMSVCMNERTITE